MSVSDEQITEMERLRQENAEMRKNLGLSDKPSGRPETLERLEKENEMLSNQKEIHDECVRLLETEEGKKEALFCLQFFRSIPLPLWVSTLDANIAYWNGIAERTYRRTRKQALGRNFIDLIVSEAEKEQAAKDLVSIIFGEEGAEHFNLCKDKDKQGHEVYLVTCCFPVFDPRGAEIVQAELSFDLRQLDALKEELDDMYVRYRQREEEERALRLQREAVIIKNLIEELFAELRQHCKRERANIEGRIERNRQKIDDKKSSEVEKKIHRAELEESQRALADLDHWEADIKREITICGTLDEHNAMRGRLWERTRKNV